MPWPDSGAGGGPNSPKNNGPQSARSRRKRLQVATMGVKKKLSPLEGCQVPATRKAGITRKKKNPRSDGDDPALRGERTSLGDEPRRLQTTKSGEEDVVVVCSNVGTTCYTSCCEKE